MVEMPQCSDRLMLLCVVIERSVIVTLIEKRNLTAGDAAGV